MMLRALAALAVVTALLPAQQPQAPRKKRLLCIGAVKGFQHDATSHGLATLWKIGQETGLWDTYIRTDTQLVTKKKLGDNARNLDYFDAIAFYTTGELDMDASQKADLLRFVKEDGKGFIGIHSGIDTFYDWPEYGEMTGGSYAGSVGCRYVCWFWRRRGGWPWRPRRACGFRLRLW